MVDRVSLIDMARLPRYSQEIPLCVIRTERSRFGSYAEQSNHF